MFLEFPKMIYGPDGESVVVEDAEEEAAQMAQWGHADEPKADEPIVIRRGPGRPRKVA